MSIYGNSLLVDENLVENADVYFPLEESEMLEEAVDPKKRTLVQRINGSIAKSLTKLGLKGSVKQHKLTHGVYKFTRGKSETFKVDIVLEDINASVLRTIINNLPIPQVIKVILISMINGFSKNKTLDAVTIISKAEDEIQKNLDKDINDFKVKIVNIERNKRYTNAIIMDIRID